MTASCLGTVVGLSFFLGQGFVGTDPIFSNTVL
jgi:hypothetical protein